MRKTTMWEWSLALGVAALAGCGGTQEAPDVAERPPAAVEAPAPRPAPVATPAAPSRDHLVWYVYWDGIHCLTVYPRAGLIRSEEAANANPTFRSRNAHFSIVSHYYEREEDWAPIVDAATSLDDFLARVAGVDLVIVEEAENPVQGQTY